MFGKWFAQTYTGSMFGAGSTVFAVWSYVVAHIQFGTVEINPSLLAAVLGDSKENVDRALEYLCSPDPASRTNIEGGCRLVREGEYLYRVPTANIYRGMRDENDRRAYNRKKMALSRANRTSQIVSTSMLPNVCRRVPPCTAVCRCVPACAVVSPSQITDHRSQITEVNLRSKAKERFAPPSLADLKTYIDERKSVIDPQAFLDFYESKGWRVGNQPMKDWRAAVRTWERREKQNPTRKGEAAPGILSVNGADLKRKAAQRLGDAK